MKGSKVKSSTTSTSRKIITRILCIVLCLIIMFTLAGCWNYRSLNDITIVVGIALDKRDTNYILTFEIIDLIESSKETGVKTKVISTYGETIFDAIRNTKKKLANKLYFGYAYVMIICQDIAKEGIHEIMDFFLRDAEPRATLFMTVSKEKTAQELLLTDGVDSSLVAYNINFILKEDLKVTGSTLAVPFYKAYRAVKSKNAFALPALKVSEVLEGKKAIESDGIAIFDDNKLISFLPADQTKYFLYAINEIDGGLLEFTNFNKKIERITFEVFSCKTNLKHYYEDNQLKFTIKPYIKASIGEIMSITDVNLSYQDLIDIEHRAEDMLAERMKATVDYIRHRIGADVIGFEDYIYKNDLKLWKQIHENFKELLKSAEISIEPNIHIINTGLTKNF